MACREFEPVCTNDEARAYFNKKGLSYSNIRRADIYILMSMLSKEIDKSNKNDETSVNTIRLSDKVIIDDNTDGSIKSAFLFLDSHYFKKRECISFEEGGFIGFAGWADIGNLNPIKRAFLRWCDTICEEGINES